jgi:hypothetical protein
MEQRRQLKAEEIRRMLREMDAAERKPVKRQKKGKTKHYSIEIEVTDSVSEYVEG